MRTRFTLATSLLAGACAFAGGSAFAQAPKTKAQAVRLNDPFADPPPPQFIKAKAKPAQADASVRRTQTPADSPALPEISPSGATLAAELNEVEGGGQSLSLQAALYGAITNNPDLVALRHSNVASPEAVEVARRFPTTLNPTLWIDYRPLSLIPPNPFPNGSTGSGTPTARTGPYYSHGAGYFYVSLRQPFELGHQTTYRHAIARAALTQQQWTVVQAELLAQVQTYRFFQTAAYRREKLRVAKQLAEFNDRLVASLRKRLEASQAAGAGADVVLAEVESQATRQQVDVAAQDYANALADLRNQVGLPETAGSAEPLGEFALPGTIPVLDESSLVQMALTSRPDIFAARAQADGSLAAANLARADRIPTPIIGPEYQTDEAQIQYFGLVYITPIPYVNNGRPLQRQREADYRRSLVNLQQMEKRAVIQVKAAAAKWNAASRLVSQTVGLSGKLRTEVERMEKLFELGQADLTRLLQVRQRLIQLENAELDALWQATQAQADLLTSLGAPHLIASLHAFEPAGTPTAAAPSPTQTAVKEETRK